MLALVATAWLAKFLAAEFLFAAVEFLAVEAGLARRRVARRITLCKFFARTGVGLAALVERGRDAQPTLLALADQDGEFGGHRGIDLEQGFHLEYADGADILLGDLALAADFRQQPFGIGIALTPDIEPEPDAIRHLARCGAALMRRRMLAFAGPVRPFPLLARRMFATRLARAFVTRFILTPLLKRFVFNVFRRR